MEGGVLGISRGLYSL